MNSPCIGFGVTKVKMDGHKQTNDTTDFMDIPMAHSATLAVKTASVKELNDKNGTSICFPTNRVGTDGTENRHTEEEYLAGVVKHNRKYTGGMIANNNGKLELLTPVGTPRYDAGPWENILKEAQKREDIRARLRAKLASRKS